MGVALSALFYCRAPETKKIVTQLSLPGLGRASKSKSVNLNQGFSAMALWTFGARSFFAWRLSCALEEA